ncbi:MAG TPA: MoxR family ATPase [Candidatus Limnocylindria bacterium]|nr:MoxR family ATPase [Candidatus Limnocylindria bacterium]
MTDGAAARGQRFLADLESATGRAVVGAEAPLRLLVTTLVAGGHALLEDVPGVGKTLLARAVSMALGLSFARVQGTPDLLPTDVTGSSILERGEFRFVPGPIFANIVLVDEINRATPRTQSSLLEAMQERQVTVEGVTRDLPEPFIVLATQNPVELEGTFALPEAQLDRFLVRIRLGYPDEDGERRISRRHQAAAEPLDEVPTVADAARLLALREAARTVRVASEVESYIVALVRATREHRDVRLGASPRASVSLYRTAQAAALLAGRDFVLPDDVRGVAAAVLEHRLLLDIDRELRGATAEGVVAEVLDAVELAVEPAEEPAPIRP